MASSGDKFGRPLNRDIQGDFTLHTNNWCIARPLSRMDKMCMLNVKLFGIFDQMYL